MNNRRDFLKGLGVVAASTVTIAAIPSPKFFIKGEIEHDRAIDIFCNRVQANPTGDELRMILRDIYNHADHTIPWIGIEAVRAIIMGIVILLPEGDPRRKIVLGSPEFTALMPIYRPVLREKY